MKILANTVRAPDGAIASHPPAPALLYLPLFPELCRRTTPPALPNRNRWTRLLTGARSLFLLT
jgi:hypothetical protein